MKWSSKDKIAPLSNCPGDHLTVHHSLLQTRNDAYASLCLPHSMREKAVRELLTRHCQLSETPESWAKEAFLTQKLCVPAEWIHEAKAVRAHMESNKHLEALYLFKAGHWNRCHKLVIRHLASGECKPPGNAAMRPSYTCEPVNLRGSSSRDSIQFRTQQA